MDRGMPVVRLSFGQTIPVNFGPKSDDGGDAGCCDGGGGVYRAKKLDSMIVIGHCALLV
jgi:hypothetical protein